ncbi:hypothetical protein [Dactylosporangium sp. NPDC049140]|uniref:hypothetical protein n=1 Tax=Dactylosporangium sp. NPDC049140 TaxID=3155647 RepID=UPI0033F82DFC
MSAINPGSDPVEGATEGEAAANIVVFTAAVAERSAGPVPEPVRVPKADADGRYGWRFGDVLVLMPGLRWSRSGTMRGRRRRV